MKQNAKWRMFYECKQLTICWTHQTGNYNYHGETQSIYVHFELPQFRYNWILFLIFHFFFAFSLLVSLLTALFVRSLVQFFSVWICLVFYVPVTLFSFFLVLTIRLVDAFLSRLFVLNTHSTIHAHTHSHIDWIHLIEWARSFGRLAGWLIGCK